MKTYWIQNKTVIITGASSGIGKELTKQLIIDYGCKVIGIAKDEIKMKNLEKELINYSEHFSYYLFDISENDKFEKFANVLRDENIIPDILINCAGYLPQITTLEKTSLEEMQKTMQINFIGAFNAYKNLSPLLKRSSFASIINISSALTFTKVAGFGAYSASKSALNAFSETLMIENDKIYVATVYPSMTKTNLFNGHTGFNNKPIFKNALNRDFVATTIIEKIIKKKNRIIIGKQAKLSNFCYRLCPYNSQIFINKRLKKQNYEAFADVFAND